MWYKNGKRHRDGDLPAIITSDGRISYWKKGSRHRMNGPAVVRGIFTEYWEKGEMIKGHKLIKLKAKYERN